MIWPLCGLKVDEMEVVQEGLGEDIEDIVKVVMLNKNTAE